MQTSPTMELDNINFTPRTDVQEYLIMDPINISIYKELTNKELKKYKFWNQFEPLAFFNLLYQQLAIICANRNLPLEVMVHLTNLGLSESKFVYFLPYLLTRVSADPQLAPCHQFIKELCVNYEFEKFSKFYFENIQDHLKTLSTNVERLSYMYQISTELKQNKIAWPALRDDFLEKYALEIELLENQIALEQSAKPKNSTLYLSDNAAENRVNEGQDNATIITTKPTFNPDAIQPFYDLLKNHFDKQHHPSLKKLLETGETSFKPLIFLDSGNRLADAFKQLKESDIITGCTKKVLESWILDHFKYSFRQKTKKFTAHYLNDIISSKNDKCQNPLLNVMLNKETGQYQITKV